jgi:hypothetical protein
MSGELSRKSAPDQAKRALVMKCVEFGRLQQRIVDSEKEMSGKIGKTPWSSPALLEKERERLGFVVEVGSVVTKVMLAMLHRPSAAADLDRLASQRLLWASARHQRSPGPSGAVTASHSDLALVRAHVAVGVLLASCAGSEERFLEASAYLFLARLRLDKVRESQSRLTRRKVDGVPVDKAWLRRFEAEIDTLHEALPAAGAETFKMQNGQLMVSPGIFVPVMDSLSKTRNIPLRDGDGHVQPANLNEFFEHEARAILEAVLFFDRPVDKAGIAASFAGVVGSAEVKEGFAKAKRGDEAEEENRKAAEAEEQRLADACGSKLCAEEHDFMSAAEKGELSAQACKKVREAVAALRRRFADELGKKTEGGQQQQQQQRTRSSSAEGAGAGGAGAVVGDEAAAAASIFAARRQSILADAATNSAPQQPLPALTKRERQARAAKLEFVLLVLEARLALSFDAFLADGSDAKGCSKLFGLIGAGDKAFQQCTPDARTKETPPGAGHALGLASLAMNRAMFDGSEFSLRRWNEFRTVEDLAVAKALAHLALLFKDTGCSELPPQLFCAGRGWGAVDDVWTAFADGDREAFYANFDARCGGDAEKERFFDALMEEVKAKILNARPRNADGFVPADPAKMFLDPVWMEVRSRVQQNVRGESRVAEMRELVEALQVFGWPGDGGAFVAGLLASVDELPAETGDEKARFAAVLGTSAGSLYRQ